MLPVARPKVGSALGTWKPIKPVAEPAVRVPPVQVILAVVGSFQNSTPICPPVTLLLVNVPVPAPLTLKISAPVWGVKPFGAIAVRLLFVKVNGDEPSEIWL